MLNLSSTADFPYAPTLGDPRLLKAIEAFEPRSYEAFESPTTLVTSGGQAALFAILFSILNPGDSVVTDKAYYPPYKNIVQLVNGQLLTTNWRDLSNQPLDRVKILLLNTPHNPTGKYHNPDQLMELADLARKYNWVVVEDAVYNQIYFDEPPISIAAFCPERTLIVNSVSKNLCLPGMRIGWITGESNFVLEIAKMHRNMNSCPNSFFQTVLAEYLPRSASFFEELRAEMKERRDLMMQIFDRLNWEYSIPRGAIYIFVKIPGLEDSFAFVKRLIKEHGVSAMPGMLFGNHPDTLRFCFGSLTIEKIVLLGERLKNKM